MKNKESIWDDTEVELSAEDLGLYEIDPFDVTHDLGYYDLELVLPVTDTRTLYLPCKWLGYIDHQCVTDSDTIWQISRTLGKYSGYGVKISDFLEITEDNPFLYDYDNSGYPVPCYEYVFKIIPESDQSTDLCFDCALLNLGDQLTDFRDEITRLMNKAADQGNYEVNHALCDIGRAIDGLMKAIEDQ